MSFHCICLQYKLLHQLLLLIRIQGVSKVGSLIRFEGKKKKKFLYVYTHYIKEHNFPLALKQ